MNRNESANQHKTFLYNILMQVIANMSVGLCYLLRGVLNGFQSLHTQIHVSLHYFKFSNLFSSYFILAKECSPLQFFIDTGYIPMKPVIVSKNKKHIYFKIKIGYKFIIGSQLYYSTRSRIMTEKYNFVFSTFILWRFLDYSLLQIVELPLVA